jgi:quinol monooxygenase YgiN
MNKESQGKFVIVAYKPKPGKEQMLLDVVKEHIPILQSQGLVEAQKAIVLKSKDGTILELFEWKSVEAIEQAHKNEVVHAMWKKFDEACTYESLANLEECKNIFAGFTRIML